MPPTLIISEISSSREFAGMWFGMILATCRERLVTVAQIMFITLSHCVKVVYFFLSFLLDCETVFYVLLAPALVSSIYLSVSKPWLNKAFDGNH